MTIVTTQALITDLFVGKPEDRWEGKPPSAIRKHLFDGVVTVTETGITEDQQADLAVHGGPEKALHHYPSEHYEIWRTTFPETATAYQTGGFGENLSTVGLTEEDLCIGDILSAGSTRLQIAQGRQPCWKLNLHTNNPGLAAAFQKTARTGWYYRVLQPGHIQAGDTLTLLERPCPDWNLKDVITARFNPRLDPDVARQLSELAELAVPWRDAFAKKIDPAFKEDTSRRLPSD